MGWFARSERRKTAVEKKEDVWVKCPACSAHIFKEEWEKSYHVCTKCKYHERLTCDLRIASLLDDNSFRELSANVAARDPLGFADGSGKYADKLKDAKEKTGLEEALKVGKGSINGIRVVTAVMDFNFIGGSLSSGTGEKIFQSAEYARSHELPYIVVSASGGARMQEGTIALMQMAKTCAGIARLKKARLPYISILTDPTFGGVSASYAMMGDVNIAEPSALIGFAGRRVIEQTIKQELPPDFQTAEYLLSHGFIDMIVERIDMKNTVHRILQYLTD